MSTISAKITKSHSTGSKAKDTNGRKFRALTRFEELTPVVMNPPKKDKKDDGVNVPVDMPK
jgi:hypothetical protein